MCEDAFSSKTLVNQAVVRKRRGALQASSAVANSGRSCLPGDFAACRDVCACDAAAEPLILNEVQTRFALRQYECPFRQKGSTKSEATRRTAVLTAPELLH